jgi:hypothetical protein
MAKFDEIYRLHQLLNGRRTGISRQTLIEEHGFARSTLTRLIAALRELKRLVEETADAIRAMLASGKLPPPVNDARCKECSLKDICQPEALAERHRLKCLRKELFSDSSPDQ